MDEQLAKSLHDVPHAFTGTEKRLNLRNDHTERYGVVQLTGPGIPYKPCRVAETGVALAHPLAAKAIADPRPSTYGPCKCTTLVRNWAVFCGSSTLNRSL